MSVRQITRVFDMRVGDYIAKAVLIKVADHADDDGLAFPSVERIAQDTEIPERTVKKKLAWLEAQGFIDRSEKRRVDGGQFSITVTRILPGAPGARGGESTGGTTEQPPGANARTRERVPSVQEPSSEPSLLRRWPAKVAKRQVTTLEGEAAVAILEIWNEEAGQSMTSEVWLGKIIGRIREHPDLSLDDHRFVIQETLRHPWWDGPASPSVVYGNGAQFERAMAPRNGNGRPKRYGRGMTTSQILEAGGVGYPDHS